MNEELNGKMVEILTSIQNGVEKASDFALSQLPEIAQSYVLYGRASATASVVLCFAMTVFFAYASINCEKKYNKNKVMEYEWELGSYVCLFAGIVSFIFAMLSLSEFFLVWLAPKVWLLKGLASLVR